MPSDQLGRDSMFQMKCKHVNVSLPPQRTLFFYSNHWRAQQLLIKNAKRMCVSAVCGPLTECDNICGWTNPVKCVSCLPMLLTAQRQNCIGSVCGCGFVYVRTACGHNFLLYKARSDALAARLTRRFNNTRIFHFSPLIFLPLAVHYLPLFTLAPLPVHPPRSGGSKNGEGKPQWTESSSSTPTASPRGKANVEAYYCMHDRTQTRFPIAANSQRTHRSMQAWGPGSVSPSSSKQAPVLDQAEQS